MRCRIVGIGLVSAVACSASDTWASSRQQDACAKFNRILDPVPHRSLSLESGSHVALESGNVFEGCEVRFETNDSLRGGSRVPDLSPAEGTDLYLSGWRMDDMVAADGPGTTIFSIRSESTVCVVSQARPAYLADNGEIVSSDTLNIIIQCR